MDVKQALRDRRSIRAFTDRPVSDEQIVNLLDSARWAPSGSNTQPWQVAVLKGDKKCQLQQKIEEAYLAGVAVQNDYIYYPMTWVDPYQARRKACGLQLYKSLNIAAQDKHRRQQQWIANYHSFHAPILLLFFMDEVMQAGSYIDYGMFLQSLMLSATEQGLATCAQAALCDYSKIIREYLGYDNNKILICGMAVGYEDTTAEINNYRTHREDVTSFTEFFD
jgi:nitroreductase